MNTPGENNNESERSSGIRHSILYLILPMEVAEWETMWWTNVLEKAQITSKKAVFL